MKYQPPRGTRDFLPEEMLRRQYVLDRIRAVFESWGFDPVETPAFEDFEMLMAKSGDAVKDEIYYFKDKSNRELGLRFELTVSLARVVAANPGLPKPFRAYHIGPVWRYDRPGRGRYREFWQADIDVIGSSSMDADALVLQAACDVMKKLGFDDFFIRINSRKINQAFVESLGITKIKDVFRSIDKLEKIGEQEVAKELEKKNISDEQIQQILRFIRIRDIGEAEELFIARGIDDSSIKELKNIISALQSEYIKFDASLVRGLEYYTGIVFELSIGITGFSAAGGGRYDNLIEGIGGKPEPAVGISFGIERIIDFMEEKEMFKIPKTKTKIFLANTGENKKEILKIAEKLMGLGIPVEFDIMERNLAKQLSYVNSKSIPFVIVIGPKELQAGAAKLRDMDSGTEKEINIKKLEELVGLLNK
jgi:histidyl-tRNA synthetase